MATIKFGSEGFVMDAVQPSQFSICVRQQPDHFVVHHDRWTWRQRPGNVGTVSRRLMDVNASPIIFHARSSLLMKVYLHYLYDNVSLLKKQAVFF
jgi:hypothetical protein